MACIDISNEKVKIYLSYNKFIIETMDNAPINTIDLSSEYVSVNKLLVNGDISSDQIYRLDASMLQVSAADQSFNNLDVASNLIVDGNFNLTGTILGPEILIIDPLPHGDNSGTVVIKGDLEVLGDLTFINLQTLDISDNIIRLHANFDAVEVGGIEVVDDTSAVRQLYWSNIDSRWDVSDSLFTNADLDVSNNANITGDLTVDGNIDLSGRIDVDDDASFNGKVDILNQLTVIGDASFNNDVDISGTLKVNNILLIETLEKGIGSFILLDESNNLVDSSVISFDGSSVIIDTSYGIRIPSGTTDDRPSPAFEGHIRYNTTENSYEGYNGSNWGELGGGLQDIDGDTYIVAETSPGADNDDLEFYTAGVRHLQIDNCGNILIGSGNNLNKFTISVESGDTQIAGTLEISGGSGGIGLTVHDDISVNNIYLGQYLYGSSIMYIDPWTHDDNSGIVIIKGNLDVQGTTTTINSTTTEVSHNIIINVPTTLSEGGIIIKDQNDHLRPLVFKNAPDFIWDLSDSIIFGENIKVKGDSSFNGNVDISENFYVNGDVSFQRYLDVSGKITTTTMTVLEDASFNGNVDISYGLVVYGDASFNGRVDISDVLNLATISGDVIIHDLTTVTDTSVKLATAGAIKNYIKQQTPTFFNSSKIQTDDKLNTRVALSFPRDNRVVIKEHDIYANLDNKTAGSQEYTFGQSNHDFYVAAGNGTSAKLMYSYDGYKWLLGPDTSNVITTAGSSVEYDGMIYIAVGEGTNTHAVSIDGINWKGLGTPLMDTKCMVIRSENGVWVCGGQGTNGKTIGYSTDGTSWHEAYSIGGLAITDVFDTYCNGLAYNGLIWVATGYDISSGYSLACSEDGILWIPVPDGLTLFTTRGNAIESNGEIFMASGVGSNKLGRSTNGVNWTAIAVNQITEVTAIACNGRVWVIGGNGNRSLEYSIDNGYTFVKIDSSVSPDDVYGLYWSGRHFIASGEGNTTMTISKDGISWKVLRDQSFNTFGGNVVSNNRKRDSIKFEKKRSVLCGEGTNTLGFETLIYDISSIGLTNIGISGSIDIFDTRATGVAHNGNLWIATGIGSNYSLAYSTNGSVWYGLHHSKNRLFTDGAHALANNEKLWIATGASGIGTDTETVSIACSYDGFCWVPIYNSTSIISRGDCVEWGEDTWLIGGHDNNTIAHSMDGIIWTAQLNLAVDLGIYDIRWSGKIFVAVGEGVNHTMSWSSDGLTWTGTGNLIFSTICKGVSWSEKLKLWVAVGNGTNTIAYSYDGIEWVGIGSTIFTTSGTGVYYNGERFVAFGKGTNTMAYSDDGINWFGLGTTLFTTEGWDGGASNQFGYVSIAGQVIAVGESAGTSISHSTNGIDWGPISNAIFQTAAWAIAYNGIVWVATGEGDNNSISYSYDGENWVGAGKSIFTTRGLAVNWNGNIWLSGGNGTYKFAISGDGLIWEPITQNVFSVECKSVTWTGLQWIAVGAGTNKIATSPDGINWTGRGNSIFTATHSIASNGFINVAVGTGDGPPAGGKMVYSYDGITWSPCQIFGGGDISTLFSTAVYGIANNGLVWVAVGRGTNTVAYSFDGINWYAAGSPFPERGYGVTWNGRYWIAVGKGPPSAIISFDGIIWIDVPHTTNVPFNTQGLAVGGLRAVIGYGGLNNELILNKLGDGLSNTMVVHGPRYYADYDTDGYSSFNILVKGILDE
jgi:cytoskeletal protein CcmA (bactofilin family)